MPEFPAKVLGEAVTRAALEPVRLKDIARSIRLVGAALCEDGKHLADCPCARHLAIEDIAEPAVAGKITEALDNAAEPPPGRRIRGPGGGVI